MCCYFSIFHFLLFYTNELNSIGHASPSSGSSDAYVAKLNRLKMERNARIRAGLSDVPPGGLDMSYKAIDFKNAIYEAGDPKIQNTASGKASFIPSEGDLETMRLAEEQARADGTTMPRKEEEQTWIRPTEELLGTETEDSLMIDKMLYGRTSLNNLASEMDGSPVTQQPEQYISSRPKYDPIVEEENNTPKAYQGGYTAPPSSEDLIPVRGPNRGDGLRAGSAGWNIRHLCTYLPSKTCIFYGS